MWKDMQRLSKSLRFSKLPEKLQIEAHCKAEARPAGVRLASLLM